MIFSQRHPWTYAWILRGLLDKNVQFWFKFSFISVHKNKIILFKLIWKILIKQASGKSAWFCDDHHTVYLTRIFVNNFMSNIFQINFIKMILFLLTEISNKIKFNLILKSFLFFEPIKLNFSQFSVIFFSYDYFCLILTEN